MFLSVCFTSCLKVRHLEFCCVPVGFTAVTNMWHLKTFVFPVQFHEVIFPPFVLIYCMILPNEVKEKQNGSAVTPQLQCSRCYLHHTSFKNHSAHLSLFLCSCFLATCPTCIQPLDTWPHGACVEKCRLSKKTWRLTERSFRPSHAEHPLCLASVGRSDVLRCLMRLLPKPVGSVAKTHPQSRGCCFSFILPKYENSSSVPGNIRK